MNPLYIISALACIFLLILPIVWFVRSFGNGHRNDKSLSNALAATWMGYWRINAVVGGVLFICYAMFFIVGLFAIGFGHDPTTWGDNPTGNIWRWLKGTE